MEAAQAIVLTGRLTSAPEVLVLGDRPSRAVGAFVEQGVTVWDEWELLDALGINEGMSQRSVRLRELAAVAPARSSWERVCRELVSWPDEELEVAVGYLEPYLADWPHGDRVARKGWAAQLLKTGRAPHMRLVAHLNLCEMGVSNPKAVRLAGSPDVRSLKSLVLSWNRIQDSGALALARSPHLRGLRRLDLSYNRISRDCAEELLASEALAHLDELNFGEHGRRAGATTPSPRPDWDRIWHAFAAVRAPAVPQDASRWYAAPAQPLVFPPRGLTILSIGSGPEIVEATIDWDEDRVHFARADLRDSLDYSCAGLTEGIAFRAQAQRHHWPCSTRASFRNTCVCGAPTR